MNRRVAVQVGLCVFVILVLVILFAKRNQFSESDPNNNVSINSTQITLQKSPPPLHKLSGKISSSEHDKQSTEPELVTWVNFYVTRDATLLDKLSVDSNNPLILIALATRSNDPVIRLRASLKLVQLDPSNASGYILAANALIAQGKYDDALKYFKQASSCPKLDFLNQDKELLLRKHFRDLGMDPFEARMKAYDHAEWSRDPLIATERVNRNLIAYFKSTADTEALLDYTTNALSLSNLVKGNPSLDKAFADHDSLQLEYQILRGVDAEMEYGESGLTVGDRLAQLKDEMALWRSKESKIATFITNSSNKERNDFFEMVDILGYAKARDQMLEQSK